jgi:flavin reductase (DIM6/NTAB) family NADH-FMN oxidoreductase RutF
MPVAIAGTMHKGKPNFMAVGWVTRVNANPPMIAIGIHQSHATHESIVENKAFSLNIPGRDLIVKTDYSGLVSGKKNDKSDVFEVFYGENKSAPLIKEAPLCLECSIVDTMKLPTNTIFVGEITGAWCDEDCLAENGTPDYKMADAFLLTMPDNRYWSMGEFSGKAWSIGSSYKSEEK